LESTRSPYHSKSHARREKKKAKEQLSGGGLLDIASALKGVDSDEEEDGEDRHVQEGEDEAMVEGERLAKPKKKKNKTGMIGEGKGATLTGKQRKRALCVLASYTYGLHTNDRYRKMERLRHPLILSNPSYSANPFATIRTHASNTLVKHQVPTPADAS
jgi:hypothetical protein